LLDSLADQTGRNPRHNLLANNAFMPILKLNEIRKAFGQTVALDGVNLALCQAEVHALIGENGAGKSTLMSIVSGALSPDDGSMELKGKTYKPFIQLDARRNGIALIHQELSLAPHLSVAENIFMGTEDSRFGWLDRKLLNRRATKVLASFSHPGIRPDTLVGELPAAARQVVEICRAIAAESDIILMDEPTSSLQRDDVEHLFRLIRQLITKGISIIYISHFLEEIREIADSFTVIRDGRSVATGKMTDVADDFLVTQMVGRSVNHLFPVRKPLSETRQSVLRVSGLSAPPELQNVNLEIRRGEILGIAGLVGAGRTKMVRTIFGLDNPHEGKITIAGEATAARGVESAHRIRQGVGYLSEDRKTEGLALALSTADNITMTRYSSCARYGWLNLTKQQRQADELIKRVGVRVSGASQSVQTLSGGNQQKVAMARLIHQEAEVLLLDEPTRGIDIGSRERIYQMIADLADQGKAILLISSYLPELFGMCDRLAVMTRGRLSTIRQIEEWTPELVLQTAIASGDND
jgi:ribose transport system ATP-binding protein